MIKVAHIISRLCYAGAEKHVLDLLIHFEKEKIPVKQYLITLQPSVPELIKELPKSVTFFQANFKKFFSLNTINQIINISEFLQKNKITIIHTHTRDPNFFGTIAAIRALTPLIISTEHTQSRFRIKNSLKDYLHRIKDYTRLEYTDNIIMISGDVKKFFLKHTRYSENKISFIYHGIDINKFKNAKSSNIKIDDNKINLAIIGRLAEPKGYIFFIEVLKELKNHINRFHFYIAGDGELRDNINNLLELYSLNNHVTLLGNINWIPSLLKSIDALIMPSQWEGFPLVALEAMASGLPVIGHNISGIRDIVINNKTGYLIELNNIQMWKKTLIGLDKGILIKMGDNSQLRIEKSFNINNKIVDLYDLYNQVLKKKISSQ